jgi:hypothetical protein
VELTIVLEFTVSMMPQRKYLVEIRFATLWGRMHAMLDAAYIPEHEKYWLISEGIHHLTFLDGLIVSRVDEKRMTKFGHMYGKDPKLVMPMQIWRESSIVKVAGKVQSKMKLQGEVGMFVGYVDERAPDTYCMYLPELNQHSRNKGCSMEQKNVFRTSERKLDACSGFSGTDGEHARSAIENNHKCITSPNAHTGSQCDSS